MRMLLRNTTICKVLVLCGCVYEFETYTVDRLQFYTFLCFDVLTHLGDEHVHAAAEEVIVLTPNVHQYLVPLQYAVSVQAEVTDQVGFTLCELELCGLITKYEVRIIEVEVAQAEFCWRIVFLLFSTP
jgi:hypothetical protein